MKIVFRNIEIHSFMSFEDEVFDFSANDGMTLIKGLNHDLNGDFNGCGKSQLGNSLLYVLFGQLQTKIKNENVVNRYAKDKNMRLVLFFDVDENKYKICRGMNNGKSSYLNLFKIENGTEVDITKSTIAETQSFLENEIIHCDITIFLRTILLTADQTYNFYTLKKNDKKEFVEKLFDISIFGDMYQALHKDLNTIDKSIVSHQNRLIILHKNKDDFNNRSSQYEEQKNVKLQTLNESLKKMNDEYSQLNSVEITNNDDLVSKLNDAICKANNNRNSILEDLRNIAVEKSKIELGISKLKSDKANKKKEIDKHSVIVAKLCNDCKEVFKHHYNIQTFEDDIVNIDKNIEKLSNALVKNHDKELLINQKNDALSQKISIANSKLAQLTSEKNKITGQLKLLESNIQNCSKNIDSLKKENNPYSNMIESNNNDILEESNTLTEFESKHNYLKFAENIVSQDTLRKFIIRDLISLLNNKIRMYLTKLGAKYYVLFNDDMDYEFIPTSGTCEFGNFSAGERMRLMIATSFAFRDFMAIRNGLNSNVLFLDEYFDSAISPQCVESVINILNEYKTEFKQNIYVISHRKEVSIENFNHVIQIEKRNDISKIVFL